MNRILAPKSVSSEGYRTSGEIFYKPLAKVYEDNVWLRATGKKIFRREFYLFSNNPWKMLMTVECDKPTGLCVSSYQ